MKTKKILSLIVAMGILMMYATVPTIVSADVPSVTINFSNPSDLEKYFDSVNGATGNWEIIDGVLTQTTEMNGNTLAYAPSNPGPINPDYFQALTLKGQMLQDFTLEFDYYKITSAEYATEVDEEMNPDLKFAREISIATNLQNGKEVASATNTGLAMTLYDGLNVRSMHTYKSYGNRALTSDVFYWTNKFHNFYPGYDLGGPIRYKYEKIGNDLNFYVGGVQITPEWKILSANGDYETLMTEYARKGAVQIYTGNGIGRLDNITISSPDLDVSKFTTSVTIDFSNPSDLETYFEPVNGATGNWQVVNGVLTQTTEMNGNTLTYAPSNPGPINPDYFQALTLRGQMLQDFTIEFDYYKITSAEYATEVDEEMNPDLKFAREISIATNLQNGKEAASATNTGLAMTLYDGLNVRSMHTYKSYGNRALTSDVFYWTNKFHNFYPGYDAGGPIRYKYVKTGNDLNFYVGGVQITPEWKILSANGDYETLMTEYARKGAVQIYTGNGIGRLDNITITSTDLDATKFGPMIDFGTYNVSSSNVISKIIPGYTVANFKANNGLLLKYGSTAAFTKNSLPLSETDTVGTGTVVTFSNFASTATSSYELLVYGDITGDGAIGLADLASAKSHLLNLSVLTGVQKQAGALTTPGKITISDLLKIKKTVLGLDTISQG